MYYYHLWLVEIPHLKFLVVPQLSLDVFRASNATSIGGSSLSADSDDWQTARSSSHATTSTRRRSANTKKTIKTETADNVASHFHTMEAIQSQNVEIRRQREKREGRLSSTLELKAVEEMIVMKREELRGLNDSTNDADDKESEEEFLRKQVAKLRKRQRTLMALIYTSDDDNDNDN